MTAALALPEAELAAYLEAHLPGFRGPLRAGKFKGGQSNPTYRLDTASGAYVLRRKPPGQLLASAHAVDREFRVLRALHGSAVPVAQPLLLCTDEGVIGSMFYVMQFVAGRVYWDPALPELAPDQRGAVYAEIMRVLAALHAIDPAAVGLGDYGKPGNYFARQVGRWTEQYRAAETGPIEATAPRVLAVVDWELSTLGQPMADLAYFCMALRLPRNPVIPGLAGLDRAALGIPDEAALIAQYRAHGGRLEEAHWRFCLAFNFFRLAAIAQGVARRAAQGNASSDLARTTGNMAGPIAAQGCEVLGL